MALPARMRFGIFMAPFHWLGENPTLSLERDMELLEWLDHLGFDEAWIGEHHSGGWETIASPELFIAAAGRTRHIKLGTGVVSLPYHHPLMVTNRMVLLDHMTKARAMLGVGPGTPRVGHLHAWHRPSDAAPSHGRVTGHYHTASNRDPAYHIRGRVVHAQRGRGPLETLHAAHFPIAVAAAQSPSGMVLVGKHGAGVLSVSALRGGSTEKDLGEFWKIAEQTAEEHGNTMDREEWRDVLHVHLAETRKDAIEQARVAAGRYQREYFENTLGLDSVIDGPPDKIIDSMVETGAWCVGTPDDLIETIERLDRDSGGFGGLLVQATEWGTREQVLHRYELIARYVMPRFQGSLVNLSRSQAWVAGEEGRA